MDRVETFCIERVLIHFWAFAGYWIARVEILRNAVNDVVLWIACVNESFCIAGKIERQAMPWHEMLTVEIEKCLRISNKQIDVFATDVLAKEFMEFDSEMGIYCGLSNNGFVVDGYIFECSALKI